MNSYISHHSLESLEKIGKLLYDLTNIPIHLFSNQESPLFSYIKEDQQGPFTHQSLTFYKNLFSTSFEEPIPIFTSSVYFEQFCHIHFLDTHQQPYHLVLGPCTTFSHSLSEIESTFRDSQLPLAQYRKLVHSIQNLPHLSKNKFLRLGQLSYYLIHQTFIDALTLSTVTSAFQSQQSALVNTFEKMVDENHIHSFSHHSLKYEDYLMNCIQEGNTDRIAIALDNPLDGEMGILSKNDALRNEKNLGICSVTLATRAAIKGGLNTELALTLSDSYIQGIEMQKDIESINSLNNTMLMDFAKRVHQCHLQKYTRQIIQTMDYIHTHLDESLTLSSLSSKIGLTPHYLGQRFCDETGIPLSQYIIEKKIEEAKKLLASSTYTMLEISSSLGFYDQSHFTKLFKRHVGTTPKTYRLKNNSAK